MPNPNELQQSIFLTYFYKNGQLFVRKARWVDYLCCIANIFLFVIFTLLTLFFIFHWSLYVLAMIIAFSFFGCFCLFTPALLAKMELRKIQNQANIQLNGQSVQINIENNDKGTLLNLEILVDFGCLAAALIGVPMFLSMALPQDIVQETFLQIFSSPYWFLGTNLVFLVTFVVYYAKYGYDSKSSWGDFIKSALTNPCFIAIFNAALLNIFKVVCIILNLTEFLQIVLYTQLPVLGYIVALFIKDMINSVKNAYKDDTVIKESSVKSNIINNSATVNTKASMNNETETVQMNFKEKKTNSITIINSEADESILYNKLEKRPFPFDTYLAPEAVWY